MERKMKQELHRYFDAPEPTGKKEFMRQVKRRRHIQKISIFNMVKMQLHYVSKIVWMMDCLFLGMAVICSNFARTEYIGCIYAMIPFFVMMSITESMRSYRYGMDELELSARFSLKSIILTRMLVLGVGNFIMLILVTFVLHTGIALENYNGIIMRTASWTNIIYMLVPYMLTAAGGLMIVRRFPNREGNYICFAYSAMIAVLEFTAAYKYSYIYEMHNINIWMIACVICVALLSYQVQRTIRMTGELG